MEKCFPTGANLTDEPPSSCAFICPMYVLQVTLKVVFSAVATTTAILWAAKCCLWYSMLLHDLYLYLEEKINDHTNKSWHVCWMYCNVSAIQPSSLCMFMILVSTNLLLINCAQQMLIEQFCFWRACDWVESQSHRWPSSTIYRYKVPANCSN